MDKRGVQCKAAGLALMAIAIGLLWFSPVRHVVLTPGRLIESLQAMGFEAALIFVGLHIIATAAGLPGSILVVAGGAVFGLFWGVVWSVIGATLGAIAAFWLARYLLRDWVEQQFKHHDLFRRLNGMVRRRALSCVFIARFIPISPFFLVNFLFGLTPIHVRPYTLGTFLGIIPGTLAYTWLGQTGYDAARGQSLTPFFVAVGLIGSMTLIPLAARWVQRSRQGMR